MSSNTLVIKNFDLKLSSLIEASAGTGKTYTISYLVIRLLLGSGMHNNTAHKDGPLNLENILIVTFTEKATADLKARVREKIRYARLGFEKYLKDREHFDKTQYETQLVEIIEEFEDDNLKTLSGALQILKRAERSVDTASIYTIHSFCNKALNRIYAFETGEAFENEFVIDIGKYQKEAAQSMWRYLFYPESDRLKLIEDNYLESTDGYTLFNKYNSYLEKVVLPDKKQGFLGYNIINLPLKLKATSAVEALDELVAYVKIHDSLTSLGDIFKRRLCDQDSVNCIKNRLYALYNPKSGNGNGFAFKSSDKSLLSQKRGLLFLKLVNQAIDDIDNLDLTQVQEAVDAIVGNDFDEPYKYFVDGSRIRSLTSASVADSNLLAESCKYFYEFALECSELLNEFTNIVLLINLVTVICIRERVELLCKRDKVIYSNDVLTRLFYILNTKESGDALARLLRQRYRVAMIDEFQDTDPIQFNIFKKLYLNEEAQDNGAACYLIGDPKQSIYEFRGSDINSYLKARNLIEKLQQRAGGVGILTLDTNYRSDRTIIESVNAMFSSDIGKSDKNAFISDNIKYLKVGHVTKDSYLKDTDSLSLAQNGTTVSIIDTINKYKAAELRLMVARRAALDIVHLLSHGRIVKDGVECEIRPGDIAVLVSSGSENEYIAEELEKLNIPSVYYSDRQSVLKDASGEKPSEDAKNIIYLMQAMMEPTRRSTLNRLLGSRLLGLNGKEFDALRSDEHYEHEIELLNKCRLVWERDGFLSAFATWYLDGSHDCLRRRLSEHGGLRRISNLYQIAELIQGVHNSISGVMAQLRYFIDLIESQDSTLIADDSTFEKRLDTQRDQVKVLTIHKSKGLEFPIVIMPFLWFKAQKKEMADQRVIPYYDENEGAYVIGFNATASKNSRDLASGCENRRLLYVAVTRARYANYMYAVDTQHVRGYEQSPVNALLSGRSERKGSFEITNDNLHAFSSVSDSMHLHELTVKDGQVLHTGEREYTYRREIHDYDEFELGIFFPESIDRRFVFTSYSAITKNAMLAESYRAALLKNDENYVADEFTDEMADKDVSVILPSLAHSGLDVQQCFNNLNYPKGAVFGTIMHNIFEKTAFDRLDGGALAQAVADIVLKEGDSNAIKLKKSWLYGCPDEDYRFYAHNSLMAISTWFDRAIRQDLLCRTDKSYALCDLKEMDYIAEMQFLMPCSAFDIEDFNRLCQKEALRVFKDCPDKSFIEGMALQKQIIDGYLNGSLDLVLRFKIDNEYKYFVLDYKSNYLGSSLSDYRAQNIGRVMFNEHHRYDVQYLIYTVVLHRYLKLRLKDYDYDRHMGGVLYLFVRGMGHDNEHGVFHTKVDYDLVLQIEQLLYPKE